MFVLQAPVMPDAQTKVIMRKVRVITLRVDESGCVEESEENKEEPEVVTLEEFTNDRWRLATKIVTIYILPNGKQEISERIEEYPGEVSADEKTSGLNRFLHKTKKMLQKALSSENKQAAGQDEDDLRSNDSLIADKVVGEEVVDPENSLVLSHLTNPIPPRKVSGDDVTNLDMFGGVEGATVSYVIIEETVPSVTTGRVMQTRTITKRITFADGQETTEERAEDPIDVTSKSKSLLCVRKITSITVGPDGKKHVSEKLEEPSLAAERGEGESMITMTRKTTQKIVSAEGEEHVFEKRIEQPDLGTVTATLLTPVKVGSRNEKEKSLQLISSEKLQSSLDHEQLQSIVTGLPSSPSNSDGGSITTVIRFVKIIRKTILLDGSEQITEETIEEPVAVPRGEDGSKYRRTKLITIVIDPNGREHITELFIDDPGTPSEGSIIHEPLKTSVATSPLSPQQLAPLHFGEAQKSVEVSLGLKEMHDPSCPPPQIQSRIRVEKSAAHPSLEVTRQWNAVDIPSTEVSEIVVPPDESDSVRDEISVSSSLVESTDIAIPEDSASSLDSPKPTEDVLRKDEDPDSSEVDTKTKTLEHGYEPDDATTMDEFSLKEDFPERGKKKTKKRQKIPVQWSESESHVPKSSPATDSGAASVSDGEAREVKTATEAQLESPRSTAVSIPSSPDDKIRVVEEGVVSRPPSAEVGICHSGQVVKSIPVFERIPTQEESAQTVTAMPQQAETEDLSVQTINEPTQEGSAQTSPCALADESLKTVEEVVEEATQTHSPELPKFSSSQSQTVSLEMKDDSIQTISPVQEQKPEEKKQETTELSTQTDVMKLSESSMQTSKPASPEKVETETGIASVQTISAATDDREVQTPIEPGLESSVQTSIPTAETSQQTIPTEPTERKQETSNSAMQTSPISMVSEEEPTDPSSSSSDQPYEVNITTSVSLAPGAESVTITDVTLGKNDGKKSKASKTKKGKKAHGASLHSNVAVDSTRTIETNVNVVVEPDVKAVTKSFIEEERVKQPDDHVDSPARGKSSESTPLSVTIDRVGEKIKRLRAKTRQGDKRSSVLGFAAFKEGGKLDPTEEEKRVASSQKDLETSVREGKVLKPEEEAVKVVEGIATWLEAIAYRIHILKEDHIKEGPSEARIKELEALEKMAVRARKSVKDVQSHLKKSGLEDQFSPCLLSLSEQCSAVERQALDTKREQENDLKRWNEFLAGVDDLITKTQENRHQLENIHSSESPARELMAVLDQIETSNRAHGVEVSHLLNSAHGLLRDFPGHELPAEIYVLQDKVRLNSQDISKSRELLEQRVALAAEYVATLEELEQITDVAESLVSAPIAVQDLQHLQDEVSSPMRTELGLSKAQATL